MIKALIFDFDGLILDTETAEFHVWRDIYREYGQEMSAQTWGQNVGGYGISIFDAVSHLQNLVGYPLDQEALRLRFRRESADSIERQPVLPGVVDYLNEAKEMDLKLAIASSSPHSWVDAHLKRLGLFEYFSTIICSDEVQKERTKPHPDLFLKVLEVLSLQVKEAIAFEDSPHGVVAAKAAGLFVVAIPNPITVELGVNGADITLPSLAALPLKTILAQVGCA
ncbi:MAG: HAD family hydrolase [Anaerolineales bacterium]|nr:HAD family hydrolase [Anaerolineales bacterium]